MVTSRKCDYLLGGKDNYAADRAAAEAALGARPEFGTAWSGVITSVSPDHESLR